MANNIVTKEILEVLSSKIVPRLSSSLYKGQAGKIGVVGGSFEYTGAPYFSAAGAMKIGVDLAHIFCERSAGTAIKSYDPDIIVHPVLETSEDNPKKLNASQLADKVINWFGAIHGLIVGPGLSRDSLMIETASKIISAARNKEIPMVIDADGLWVVSQNPDLIKGYSKVILTPNVVEYKRLCDSLCPGDDKVSPETLAQKLGNITIVRKGATDVITDGISTLECTETGSLRRCGGQGDILTGALGTFLIWSHKAVESGEKLKVSPTVIAGFAGCFLARKFGEAAFEIHKRSFTTKDMLPCIGKVMQHYFPV